MIESVVRNRKEASDEVTAAICFTFQYLDHSSFPRHEKHHFSFICLPPHWFVAWTFLKKKKSAVQTCLNTKASDDIRQKEKHVAHVRNQSERRQLETLWAFATLSPCFPFISASPAGQRQTRLSGFVCARGRLRFNRYKNTHLSPRLF